MAGGEPYRPHLSLFYGGLAEAARQDLAARFEPEIHLPFPARRLELWDTRGDVETWVRVAAAGLQPL